MSFDITRVDIGSIKEVIDREDVDLSYIRSKYQAADIFTKILPPLKWIPALEMLNMRRDPDKGESFKKAQLALDAIVDLLSPPEDPADEPIAVDELNQQGDEFQRADADVVTQRLGVPALCAIMDDILSQTSESEPELRRQAHDHFVAHVKACSAGISAPGTRVPKKATKRLPG